MEAPRMLIGIVTYNSLEDLPGCFEGIRAQDYPHLRVTVLDNVSQDGSADWVRQHAPQAQLIVSPRNGGYGYGHNRIIETLQPGEYYLALNPDVRLQPDYVSRVAAALAADPQAGWAVGKLLLPDGKRLYSAGHAVLRNGFAFNIGYGEPSGSNADGNQWNQLREVFGAAGAAVVIKDTLIAEFGTIFDEAMFLYNEDVDFDWRARRQGWKCLYVPDAAAYHRGSSAGEALQIEAVTNRYLSALKNAYIIDLLTYNLPYIALHTAARIAVTPRLGLKMAARLIRLAPHMLRQRQKPRISRREMRRWFTWSAAQPGAQRSTLAARIGLFRQRRAHKGKINDENRAAV